MGGTESRDDNIGFRILNIQEGSPAQEAGLQTMLDFIIYPPDDVEDDSGMEFVEFTEFLKQSLGKKVQLKIFNIITQEFRIVDIVPRDNWGGKGLLGASIRNEDYSMANAKVLRILNFYVNSPLHKAGFEANHDYILGTLEKTFEDIDEFSKFIYENNEREIEFFVYNSKTETVRKVQIIPSHNWGGYGSLGGDIGFGIMNRLPSKEIPPQISNEGNISQENKIEDEKINQETPNEKEKKDENDEKNEQENKLTIQVLPENVFEESTEKEIEQPMNNLQQEENERKKSDDLDVDFESDIQIKPKSQQNISPNSESQSAKKTQEERKIPIIESDIIF